MTKLKTLLVVIIIGVVFLLWMPIWQAEQDENSQSVVEDTQEDIIYTFDMTKERLTNGVNELIGNYDISKAIVDECTTQVEDYITCIKSVVGVANAESTMFTKGMYPTNNWLWLMYRGRKRRFSSVEEWIHERVSLYKKNDWEKRTTWASWLKWKYCTSECKYRVKNYESAIKKLNLD